MSLPSRMVLSSRTLLNPNAPLLLATARRNFFAKKCPQKVDPCKGGVAEGGAAANPAGEIPAGYKMLKETQAKFQLKDELPVWLKGGPNDRIMYLSTVGLALAGLGGSVLFIANMILTT
uniref:Putative cytochrome c oxidase subunit viia n=1 Tax=Culex tarsalis TaxID=7177 RepID=A0A1Q3FTM6_CULTA